MNRKTIAFAAAAGLFAALPALAQEFPNEGPAPTTTVVNIESKGNAPVDASTLTLQVNGHNAPIDSLTTVTRQPIELAILMDEGLRGSVGLQLDDMKKFIQQLPPNVRVMLGFMQNGTVRAESGFTENHEAVAGQVRLPLSVPGGSASPYFCLSDFVKHWPSQARVPRFVLFITNGVDPYNGSTSILNQDSPYVRNAQDDAQRAGVVVYSLYFGDAGIRGGRANFSGQSYLQQLSEATGGQSLYTGEMSPVSFDPYLKAFSRDLEASYLLGFRAMPHKDDLVRLKVKSNEHGVKVHAADSVRPGMNE